MVLLMEWTMKENQEYTMKIKLVNNRASITELEEYPLRYRSITHLVPGGEHQTLTLRQSDA